ncbi:hypothetical protein Q9L58_002723 [Maublancomyces gigas]|uniref:Uncharacterized protein n=1 Tax=Discina gigas TaxID=1032678 RepID=A0ABR3GQQ5_9PEZI
MTRDESPPPAYNAHDPGSSGLDLEEGVGQNEASRTEPQPQPVRPRTARPKRLFADREDSDSPISPGATRNALNWWKKKGRKFIVFLLNLLFFVIFIMDIVGTHRVPWSTYYRDVVHSRSFRAAYVMIGFFTGAINLLCLLTNFFHEGFRGAATCRKCQATEAEKADMAGFAFLLILALFIVWPMIEVFGIHRRIQPAYSCLDMGFRSSILLDVLGGVTGNRGMSQFPNNITIRSGDEVFGLSMSPTIQKWGKNDQFSLTPLSQTTTPDIFPRVASYEVTIFLSDNIHQFRRIPPEANNTIVLVNGTFIDDPSYYLSFPALSPPMHSTTKVNWSYIEKRPWVELVTEEGSVLRTVRSQHGDRENTMMRMCGAWSVTDMMEDLDKMQGVLVGLARMMIEMMKWGLDY